MKSSLFPFILPLFAYLLGSVPFGWIIAKVFYHKDIRKGGSGNVGATNALRLYGTTTGVIVLLLDMGKGFLATQLAIYLMPSGSPIVAMCALFVILGHVFPLYLGFKGGKGVATAGGAFLALAPMSLLFALGVFILITAVSRYVSMGSIIAAIVFLIHSLWQIKLAEKTDYASVVLIALVVLMIVIKHKENLVRLVKGTEHKIVFTRKGKG
ncbi:MAG: glycerol-3-phosphate 1-O-acyltransferase PlsY [Candidatus Cloacimonetes bacterium]|nr:glycerol-3-phosphate 1-O-acyltransferase PlsY [Candidatus Cloacimonadota bacterium]MDD3235004.1 glycerol-3-phosphate 1-O-acyltransferase PlsY [Candidatus Cloacimonadota bacterium]